MKKDKLSGCCSALLSILTLLLACAAGLPAQINPAERAVSKPAATASVAPADHAGALRPPVARQDNVKETIHGVEIVDPYRWLEHQDSDETKNWVAAENAYTHSLLDGLPMRELAHKRLLELVTHDAISSPAFENGYYFFWKRAAGQDLWSLY